MAHVPAPTADRASRWTYPLVGLVSVGFVVAMIVVAAVFPDPRDGPAPGQTRVAAFAVCAVFAVAIAAIPLVVGILERRSGRHVAFGWRLALVCGVVIAMTAVGIGVWIWAFPPLHTECFTAYHHDDGTGAYRICESGRLNGQLGLDRLNQGLTAGAGLLVLTALAAAGLRRRSEPPA